jgi:FkbM family methyltransferase
MECMLLLTLLAGANMGDFSIFLAAATGPSGVVYAFEPQARMFQLVCTNMIIK